MWFWAVIFLYDIFVFCFYSTLFYYLESSDLFNQPTCSNETAIDLLDELCEEYELGDLDGNLCSGLCETKTLRFQRCIKIDGVKTVLVATCEKPNCNEYKDTTIVIKRDSRPFIDINRYKYTRLGFPKECLKENGKWSSNGKSQLLTILNTNSTLLLPQKELDELLWNDSLEKFSMKSRLVYYSDVINLLKQREFRYLIILNQPPFLPYFYGACGSYIAVEYVSSFLYPKPWKDKTRLGLEMLRLVHLLESAYSEPLHFCDLKEDNLGFSREGYGVKVTDYDMIWSESLLNSEFSQMPCNEDSDCEIVDCHSVCNKDINTCRPYRINSNLQVVCKKIFLTYETPCLLCNPPRHIAEELTHVLVQCSTLKGTDNFLDSKNAEDVFREKLKKLLTISR